MSQLRLNIGAVALCAIWLMAAAAHAAGDERMVAGEGGYGGPYGIGHTAGPADIAAWNIDIDAKGNGLPQGAGTATQGDAIYRMRCQVCHGADLEGVKQTGGEPLVGGRGTLTGANPVKTVESYWPLATTLYDYINRAMPFDKPGSLQPEEIYSVVAFILAKAGIIAADQEMNAQSLPRVRMPNRDGFFPDDRPDVFDYN